MPVSTLLSCCVPIAYRCDEDSYLVIKFLDGRREYLTGPTQQFLNRWVHDSISVVAHRRYVATEKQCLDVVTREGKFDRRQGPCQVTFDPLVHDSIKVNQLTQHIASQNEYLIVQYKDGRKDHVRGPHALTFHPLEHETVSVHEALKLAANEAIVVYRRMQHATQHGAALVAKLEVMPTTTLAHNGKHAAAAPVRPLVDLDAPGVPPSKGHCQVAPAASPPVPSGGARPPLLTAEAAGQEGAMHVERRVVHGPAVFIPDSNEWLHTFSWHGTKTADGKGSKTGYCGDVKVPHALNFTVIRCMPDQLYLTVRDVRTVDDASLTVHLMLFYELQSIETMLDQTNDMIGDFVNAAAADVMTFASRLTYETFLQETAELSRTANFPILTSRMAQIGVDFLKVVYRGYGASSQLQEMHDQAISRRTKLRLEADAAREEQEKRAMELRCRRDRSVQEQELEAAAAKHRCEVLAVQKAQERALQDEEHAQKLRYASEREQAERASERARHEDALTQEKQLAELRMQALTNEANAELQKYDGLQKMGVDLTAYLVALAAATPDQHIKLDHGGQPNPPTVHLEIPRAQAGRVK